VNKLLFELKIMGSELFLPDEPFDNEANDEDDGESEDDNPDAGCMFEGGHKRNLCDRDSYDSFNSSVHG